MTRLVVLLLCCVDCIVSLAQPISENKAVETAIRFYQTQVPDNQSVPLLSPHSTVNMQSVDTKVLKRQDRDCIYVVNMPDSGWVLVSGDERIEPILAICKHGTFPTEENMPPAMKGLLNEYMREIIFIQDSCPQASTHVNWEAIDDGSYFSSQALINVNNATNFAYTQGTALLNRPNRGEVKWNQSGNNGNRQNETGYFSCEKSYNKFCPNWYDVDGCGRTVVGCTAVAIAQIMWYWQWPHTGLIHSGIDHNGNPTGSQSLHLYNWNLMPSAIFNSSPIEEVDMIAGFLRDCGYATNMQYGLNGSASNIEKAKNALENIFAYGEIDLREKNFFSWNWKNRIKNEIDAGRPLYYRGDGESGGHAFVVDGYNNDHFHINWGWGTTPSGYFTLDDLAPNVNSNFTSNQAALFGIQPAPACGSASVNGGNNYRVGVAGEVSVSNLTVPSGQTAVYYSGTSVRLLPGFHASAGSHTHVAIQNFPCSGIAPLSARSADHEDDLEQKTDLLSLERPFVSETLVVYPNPTGGNLTVESSKLINQLELYGLDGEKQMESQGTTIDLHPLQVGMYILVVRFSDGTTRSCKVAKSL